MNLRIAIPLTMMVSFTLTCAFILWNRRLHDQARAAPVIRQLEPVSGLSPAAPLSNAPMAQPLPRSLQANAENDRNVALAAAYAKSALPIQISYRRSPNNAQAFVATLLNKTEEAVTLEVIVFNPASEQISKTQLSMEPNQTKKIGLDDGLELASGDRITLRNPSYNDLVEEIRPH